MVVTSPSIDSDIFGVGGRELAGKNFAAEAMGAAPTLPRLSGRDSA